MARLGRRYPVQPVLKKLTPLAAAASKPVPPPHIQWRAASANATRLARTLRHVRATGFGPAAIVFPAVLRVSPGLTFVHEINDDNPRTRKALQQLSDTFNNLKRSGELTGTFAQPALGYVPANTAIWGGNEPGTIREALNKIAAALTDLGVNLGDY